jgi:N-acetylglucosamine malate deacetylase 1
MNFHKKFLIITAHPDDAELGCAGLIQKIKYSGGTVTNLIMVQPSKEINTARSKEIVEKELKKSKELLEFDVDIHQTKLHDNGRPNLVLDNNLITELEDRYTNFDVIISHWHEDYHQDHKTCYDIARILSRKNFQEFWCMDLPFYNLYYKQFQCNLYVDITDYVDNKIKALGCYDSYFDHDKIENAIRYNKYKGSIIGKNKTAETFSIMHKKI